MFLTLPESVSFWCDCICNTFELCLYLLHNNKLTFCPVFFPKDARLIKCKASISNLTTDS